jgi:hypothetical protein
VRIAVISLVMAAVLTGNVFAEQTNGELILKLKEDIIRIQNQSELGIKKLNLCRSVVALGTYVPLEEAKIEVGKEYYIYYEPANVFTKMSEGRYEFWFTQDMILLDGEGEVLMERLGALSMHFNTATPLLDIYVTNDLLLTAAPPGKYIYKIVLHDVFKDESVVETIDFEVVE